MGLRSFGTMGVDWEARVDFDRLRRERLARAKAGLEQSELGALLCFDMNNTRYITATHIGTWAIDKLVRFCLLPQGDEPIMWDFGSAAASETCTIELVATMVTSSPLRFTSATPNGIVYSSAGTSPFSG